ncbi:MAG: UpxY family transcription antiterminator [Chitinophagaceae bacterium]|nr:UpxY family transcription antiterminator [Chitinophagaceae bacterium]
MNEFKDGWYLIYTRPRHEKKVYHHLAGKNINSFLPTRKVLRTWHDRKKYIDEPLFPSYVFIYINDVRNYYEGMEAEGALYYVRDGKKIARVGDNIVDSIKLVSENAKELEVSELRFQPGRRLVISQGSLTGLECEVVQINNKHKLLVRVELLQRSILVTLPVESLMAV